MKNNASTFRNNNFQIEIPTTTTTTKWDLTQFAILALSK